MLNFQEVSKLFPKLAPLVLPSQCQPSARFGDTSRQPRRWGQFRIEGGHFSTDDGTSIFYFPIFPPPWGACKYIYHCLTHTLCVNFFCSRLISAELNAGLCQRLDCRTIRSYRPAFAIGQPLLSASLC